MRAPFFIPLAISFIAGTAAAGDVPWMPIEIGAKKTFVHAQERVLKTAGDSLGEERWLGTREEWVLQAPRQVANATAELRSTTRLSTSGEAEQVETQRLFVSPTASAYQIHSAEIEVGGQRYAIAYPRPAIALKENAKPGEKWHVSNEDVAGLRGETWGEVIGIQDARTPAGLFEQCLVVRYTVELSGTLEVPGVGAMDVVEGHMVVTEWHAKGIGLVLSKEELSETLIGPNGVEMVAEMKAQSALKQYEGLSQAASPAH